MNVMFFKWHQSGNSTIERKHLNVHVWVCITIYILYFLVKSITQICFSLNDSFIDNLNVPFL